jgi:hypothetical protein
MRTLLTVLLILFCISSQAADRETEQYRVVSYNSAKGDFVFRSNHLEIHARCTYKVVGTGQPIELPTACWRAADAVGRELPLVREPAGELVFDRYDIVDERDIADAVQKLEKHQNERNFAQSLHTAPKNEKTQPAKVGLTH